MMWQILLGPLAQPDLASMFQVVAENPAVAAARSNLGVALKASGRLEEAEAQLLRTGSHLDPEAMEALRTQVKLELPETEARAVVEAQEERDEAHYERTGEHLPAAHFTGVGNAVSEVHKESRLVESLVEAAYFAQVGAQHPELAAVAQNAVEQSAKDRQRWMDTAIREALARLAPKKPKGE